MIHLDGGVAAADASLPSASPEPLLNGVIAAAEDASSAAAESLSLLIVDSAGGVIIAAAGDASPSTPESSSLLRIADSAVAGVEVLPEVPPHGQQIQSGSKADLPRQIRGRSESHHGQILIASTLGSIEDHAGGPHVNSSGVAPHVMLSYEWGSQKNVLLIKKELERSGE